MISRLLVLLLSLSAASLQARLGETLAECEKRYGPASEPTTQKLPTSFRRDVGTIHVFHPDGWEIWTCMVDGVCVLQFYQKPLNKDIRWPFFVEEEEAIKEAESGGLEWKKAGTVTWSQTDPNTGFKHEGGCVRWTRSDGIYLTTDKNRMSVMVQSPRWSSASKEADEKAKEDRLGKLKKF